MVGPHISSKGLYSTAHYLGQINHYQKAAYVLGTTCSTAWQGHYPPPPPPLFSHFGQDYDACVLIHDMTAFAHRFEEATKECFPSAEFVRAGGPVTYVAPLGAILATPLQDFILYGGDCSSTDVRPSASR